MFRLYRKSNFNQNRMKTVLFFLNEFLLCLTFIENKSNIDHYLIFAQRQWEYIFYRYVYCKMRVEMSLYIDNEDTFEQWKPILQQISVSTNKATTKAAMPCDESVGQWFSWILWLGTSTLNPKWWSRIKWIPNYYACEIYLSTCNMWYCYV